MFFFYIFQKCSYLVFIVSIFIINATMICRIQGKKKKDDAFQFFNRIYFFPNLFTHPFPNIDSIINLDTSQIRKLLRVICFRNRKIMWKAALLVVILSAATNKSKYSINFTISFLKIFLPFLFSPA